jgi:hypothetical protein
VGEPATGQADDLTGGTIYEPVRRHLREAAGGTCD